MEKIGKYGVLWCWGDGGGFLFGNFKIGMIIIVEYDHGIFYFYK